MYGGSRGFGDSRSYRSYGGYPIRSSRYDSRSNISYYSDDSDPEVTEQHKRLERDMAAAGIHSGAGHLLGIYGARMEFVKAHPGQYPIAEMGLEAYECRKRIMAEIVGLGWFTPPTFDHTSRSGASMGGHSMASRHSRMPRPLPGGLTGAPPRTTPGGGRGSQAQRGSGFHGSGFRGSGFRGRRGPS